jgi:hypothetical protein
MPKRIYAEREDEEPMRHPRHPKKGLSQHCHGITMYSCTPRCTAFLGETNTHNLRCDSPLVVTLSHCDCPPKTWLEVPRSELYGWAAYQSHTLTLSSLHIG